jgi:hypothetical protein
MGIWHQLWHWVTQPVDIFAVPHKKKRKSICCQKTKNKCLCRSMQRIATLPNPKNFLLRWFSQKNQLAQSCASMAFIHTKKVNLKKYNSRKNVKVFFFFGCKSYHKLLSITFYSIDKYPIFKSSLLRLFSLKNIYQKLSKPWRPSRKRKVIKKREMSSREFFFGGGGCKSHCKLMSITFNSVYKQPIYYKDHSIPVILTPIHMSESVRVLLTKMSKRKEENPIFF